MSFDYIEQSYGRKFYRGQRVVCFGKLGNVVRADQYVHVKIDGQKHANPYHPTDVEPTVTCPTPSAP